MAHPFDNNDTAQERPGLIDQHGNPLASAPELALPYQETFSAIIQGASNTWMRSLWDEALAHSRENALAMRRDW